MMKNFNVLGSMLVAILIVGCDEKPAPDAAQTAPAVEEANIAVAPATTVAVVALDKVENQLPERALASVDAIGDLVAPKSGSVIPVTGDILKVAGFAVDEINAKPAAGVVVMVDNLPFVATYGGERPDIAAALNNPAFVNSQFYVEIPTTALASGLHDVTVRVVASDRSGYYTSDWSAKISKE